MFSDNPKCPFCGNTDYTPLKDGKCKGCGRRVELKHCIVCRRIRLFSVNENEEGCWSCGGIFSTTQPEDPNLFTPTQNQPTGFTLCPNCGSLTRQKELICQNCGAPIQQN